MKKILITTTLFTPFSVLATTEAHDYTQVITVQAALNMIENKSVTLEGYLVKQRQKHKFIFKDTAGQDIEVDINRDIWRGMTVVPTDKIRIQGEIKINKQNEKIIEVERLTKL